jgi:hypothetical protein
MASEIVWAARAVESGVKSQTDKFRPNKRRRVGLGRLRVEFAMLKFD